jgi:glutamate dehydrogenase
MSTKEFLDHKEAYVKDVMEILKKRAEEEANLIFQKHRKADGKLFYTEISDAISVEINNYYDRLFNLFQANPEWHDQPLFRKVLLNRLPTLIRETPKFRARVKRLTSKIKSAILSSEIASHIVYYGGWEMDFGSRLKGYVKEQFTS